MKKVISLMLLIFMLFIVCSCNTATTTTNNTATTITTGTTSTIVLPRFNSAIARSGEVANSIRLIASAEDPNAVIYFIIIYENAQNPTNEQIKAGQDYGGVIVHDKGSAAGTIVEDRIGLVGGTTYKVAFVLELNGVFSNVYFRSAIATSDDDLVDRGDGSALNPFWVETEADLKKVGTGIDGWANTLHYILKNDIDLNGVEWIPIGKNDDGSYVKFDGTFDGNGYVVSNIKIINQVCNIDPLDPSKNEKSGFFCELDVNGVIKNLHLRNVNITSNEKRVGGLVGYSKGRIENVSVIGGTIESTTVADSQLGGIVGSIYEVGSISKAFVNVTVKGEGKRVGGIVGSVDVSDKSTMNITISDVYSLGDVISTANQVGGIAGYLRNTTVDRAYASGNIYGSTDIGGLIGFMQKRSTNTMYDGQPELKNSFYIGTQIVAWGDASGNMRAGAIIGNLSSSNNTNALLENIYSLDSVFIVNKSSSSSKTGTITSIDNLSSLGWLSSNLLGWDFSTVWELPTQAIRPILKGVDDNGSKVEKAVELLISSSLSKGETAGQIVINIKSNKLANIYYVLVAKGQTAPTIEQVKAGIDYNGVTVVATNQLLNTNVLNETKTLLINTEYDLYAYAEIDGEATSVSLITGTSQDLSVQEKLIEAKAHLSLDINEVTSNLTLPTTSLYESTITWTSSHVDVVTKEGILIKPNVNVDIVLTALITINGETISKDFTLTVLGKTIEEKLSEAKDALLLELTIVNVSITLPDSGLHDSSISWSSSHPDIIANDGAFISPLQETVVTLTATITIDGQSMTKDFILTATATTIEEKLNEAKDALTINTEESEHIDLPLFGINGTTISWVSSNTEVITDDGLVVKPDQNTDVILTATISLNGESITKEFIVTVLGKTIEEKLAEAQAALSVVELANSDLDLPMIGLHGAQISWLSSHPDVISDTGIYVMPATSIDVTLTAIITIDGQSVTKTFMVTAIGNEVNLPWGGEDPSLLGYYPIYSVSDLEALRDGINNLTIQKNSNVKLMRDIDLSIEYGVEGKNWTPIVDFSGTFDGNHLTINGLYINSTSAEVGLFGNTSVTSVIKNLTLANVDITGGTATGSLVGMFKGRLENITISGGSVNSTNHTDSRIGGLVGRINEGTISNVTVDVDVYGGKYVGGVIGHADYLTGATTEVIIEDVVSYSNVYGKEAVGGVVGYFRVSLRRVVAYGDIIENTQSTHTTLKNFGGVIGYMQNNGNVTLKATIEDVIAANGAISISNTSTSAGVAPVIGSTSTSNGALDVRTTLYYLNTIVVQGKSYSNSVSGTEITLTELIDVNWYAIYLSNFDFIYTWQIANGEVILK